MISILTLYLTSFAIGVIFFIADYLRHKKKYYKEMIRSKNGKYYLRKILNKK